MNYADQWRALSSRIRGLMDAGHLHARYLNIRSSDAYGRAKRLREQCECVLTELRSFKGNFKQSLPPTALKAIDDFVARTDHLITDANGTPDSKQERVWAALVSLSAFETEMSFILSDIQESIHIRSERAFLHLQRSIVADADFRGKWSSAFDNGEVACEKLGAVHLLLHGIWAFKVDAAGARTDLVYQEPVTDLDNLQRYADGIVLTEWKKAKTEDESSRKFEAARHQARCYAQGALAGIELTIYRYSVVVSRNEVVVPDDINEGGVIYRHINISVEPRTPSRSQL